MVSYRSALLICGALIASTVAPAQAGPSSETLSTVASATLAKTNIPQLLDPNGQPQLAAPQAEMPAIEAPETDTDQGDETAEVQVDRKQNLAAMVAQLRSSDPGSREIECLATGIYFESKSEPLAGQLAVGQVIANRAESRGRFPSSYCGVLFQRGQFSFIRGKSLPKVPRASRQWQTAVAVAKIVDRDLKESEVGDALFFHARYVSPGWRLKRVASIGNHIFFR